MGEKTIDVRRDREEAPMEYRRFGVVRFNTREIYFISD
jgi:hypothetical protein